MYSGMMTVDEAAANNYKTVYFPIASFTQHGPHLPLTTDILIAQALGAEISTRINAFMLPVQPYGTCMEQADKYSTGVDPGLLYDMVADIARELKRQGFRRLILHQGYSGLGVLYPLTRSLYAIEGIKTVLVNPYSLVAGCGGLLQAEGNMHACELQTSLMMYLNAECVRADKIEGIDHVPNLPPSHLSYKPMLAFCPDGVWGCPSLAGAEKGKMLYEKAIELSVEYINEAFAFMDKHGDYTGGREMHIDAT